MLVQMDVRSVLSIIFRHLGKFLLVFVPIIVIGLFYVLTTTRYYESNSVLLVKFGQDARPEIAMGGAGVALTADEKRGLVQSNLNILVSRDITTAVLNDIGIDKIYPALAKKNLSQDAKIEAAVKEFQKDFQTKTESDAGTIRLSFASPDPKVAENVLSRTIDIFVQKQTDIFGNPQIELLNEQAQRAKARLDEATQALNVYKNENGIASIDEELSLLLKQRADLTGYMSRRQSAPSNKAVSDAKSVKNSYGALPAQIGMDSDGSRFPVIEEAQKRIDDLRAQEAELLLTYKPDSERVKSVQKNIALERASLNKSVGAINAQIESLNREIEMKQSFRAKYDELTRNVEYAEDALKTAQQRQQVAQINSDLNERKITRISVIEKPTLPVKPSKPNRTMTMILCGLIAGFFGVAIVLCAELLDSTFYRPEQLKAEFKKDVLASFSNKQTKGKKEWTIPKIMVNEKISKLIPTRPSLFVPSTTNKTIIKTPVTKELAALYHGLGRALPANGSRIVNFASTHKGEGTTTIAYEIAKLAASSAGQTVLFIASENFLPENDPIPPRPVASLIDVAAGRAPLKDALSAQNTEAGNITHAHLQKGNGIEGMIGGIDKIGEVLNELKRSFSLIIIPTPGILTNPATAILTRSYDGIVFVVEAERTRAPVAKQAVQILDTTGQKLLGFVLNKQRHYIPGWIYKQL